MHREWMGDVSMLDWRSCYIHVSADSRPLCTHCRPTLQTVDHSAPTVGQMCAYLGDKDTHPFFIFCPYGTFNNTDSHGHTHMGYSTQGFVSTM